MCKEIEELGIELKRKGYDLSKLTEEQLEEASNILLNKFKLNQVPIDIVQAADIMGLQLLKVIFINNPDNHIGGALAVSSNLQEQGYRKDKVIKVNKLNSQGHQRFSIIHEVYHYIFDSFFKQRNEEYYDVFYEDNLNSEDENEKRANRFAAAFLMPKEDFTKEYLYLKVGQGKTEDEIYSQLSKKFLVSETAVEKRISELVLSE